MRQQALVLRVRLHREHPDHPGRQGHSEQLRCGQEDILQSRRREGEDGVLQAVRCGHVGGHLRGYSERSGGVLDGDRHRNSSQCQTH